jgi:hypothetical protein
MVQNFHTLAFSTSFFFFFFFEFGSKGKMTKSNNLNVGHPSGRAGRAARDLTRPMTYSSLSRTTTIVRAILSFGTQLRP